MPSLSQLSKIVNDLVQDLLAERKPSSTDPIAPQGIDLNSLCFRGNNQLVFNWRDRGECVLYGPAGSGKTYATLALLRWFCETYPGSRCLMLRKTRVSLTESAMVTWERAILGETHPILSRPCERSHRHAYKFPNGSVVVTGGLDNPGKILSTEYDLIYVNEATDLTLTDWETLTGRLRSGKAPFDLLFGDCNPTSPGHWIYKRAAAGRLTLLPTTHKDNPHYWDATASDWTVAGRRYVLDRLGNLTGARRTRFLEGEWAAAEGLVYTYNPKIHALPHDWQPPREWKRYWSIDWGFRDPLVIQFWAADGDGRLYLYRERFKTETRVETAARWCRELLDTGDEPPPEAVVTDHDPECVATFERYAGVRCTPADKGDRDGGIQFAQGRFDVAGDDRPRIYFRSDARCHPPDRNLEDNGRPTSTLEELVGYIWKPSDPDRPKDEPISHNDHGMDALRYLCTLLDSQTPSDPDFYSTPIDYGRNRLTY